MIIKEPFEGPVGDYCISRNTIKRVNKVGVRKCFTSITAYSWNILLFMDLPLNDN